MVTLCNPGKSGVPFPFHCVPVTTVTLQTTPMLSNTRLVYHARRSSGSESGKSWWGGLFVSPPRGPRWEDPEAWADVTAGGYNYLKAHHSFVSRLRLTVGWNLGRAVGTCKCPLHVAAFQERVSPDGLSRGHSTFMICFGRHIASLPPQPQTRLDPWGGSESSPGCGKNVSRSRLVDVRGGCSGRASLGGKMPPLSSVPPTDLLFLDEGQFGEVRPLARFTRT